MFFCHLDYCLDTIYLYVFICFLQVSLCPKCGSSNRGAYCILYWSYSATDCIMYSRTSGCSYSVTYINSTKYHKPIRINCSNGKKMSQFSGMWSKLLSKIRIFLHIFRNLRKKKTEICIERINSPLIIAKISLQKHIFPGMRLSNSTFLVHAWY